MRDLKRIESYLSRRSPSGARSVLAAIKAGIDHLESFPGIGRLVDEQGHRRIPVLRYPYLIFYRIADDEVLLLHIRHASRKPMNPAVDLT